MLNNSLKLLMAACISVSLLGCQSGSDETPKNSNQIQQKAEQESKKTFSNGITIEIKKLVELREDKSNYKEFESNLNVYSVSVAIPENLFNSELQIVGTESADLIHPSYEVLDKDKAKYKDGFYYITKTTNPFLEDKTVKSVAYKVYKNEEVVAENKVKLMPDLIFSESTTTTLGSLNMSSGAYDVGVLYFKDESVLNTNGAHISFSAKRVVSEGATIETFSAQVADEQAKDLSNGQDGGSVSLKIENASGELHLKMRGTRGGKGHWADKNPAVGGPGGKGENGKSRRVCEPMGPLSVRTNLSATMALDAAPLRGGRSCENYCSKNPTNGAPGQKGPVGFSGYPGLAGGNSGTVKIAATAPHSDFVVDVVHIPGQGGPGGDGGEGGNGGPGGPPGDGATDCNSAGPGPQGPPGDKGPQGEQGPQGTISSESSVFVNGKKIY